MDPKVVVGGKEQIAAISFLVADNVEAELSVPVTATSGVEVPVRFLIKFVPDLEAGAQASSEWVFDTGTVRFTFRGWTSPLGTSFVEPARLGDVTGIAVSVQIMHCKIGALNQVHWYVYLGGP